MEIGGLCHIKEPSFVCHSFAGTEKLIKSIRAQDAPGMLELGETGEAEQLLPDATLKKLEAKPCQGGIAIQVRVQDGPLAWKTFWVPDIYLLAGEP